MKFKSILFLILGLILLCGCEYPKHLKAYQITRDQINIIKNIIIQEGYIRGEREDFRWEGAFQTNYLKDINIGGVIYKINIHFSFRPTKNKADVYRNAGIYIEEMQNKGKNIPEVQMELYRMEDILYKKLIELLGQAYVERGIEPTKPLPPNLEPIDEF